MPRKNGTEVLAEVRSHAELHCIPVIVLSTSSIEDDVGTCYRLGANCFITKPVNLAHYRQRDKPVLEMEQLVTLLGNSSGGPRDLVDIHLAALREVNGTRRGAAVMQGRLLVLEMMGRLVDYYRAGQRRSVE